MNSFPLTLTLSPDGERGIALVSSPLGGED
jgi:hypothetical protein